MLVQLWRYVVKPTQVNVTLSNSMMLAQCWSYLVHPTPTISQRYKGLPTLIQRSHVIWGDVVYSPTINLFSDGLPWASSPWPTITNHEVMLIVVADPDKFFRTKKGKVILFPNKIIFKKAIHTEI